MSGAELAGRCVLVTRPAAQSAELNDLLAQAGCEVLHLPVIDIHARTPTDIAAQVAAMPEPDLVIFVSRNAVEHGLMLLGPDTRVAAIGPATAAALEERDIAVDIQPASGYDTESLLEHPDLADMAGKHVRIVRGQSGRELLGDSLKGRGAEVEYVAVYDRVQARPASALLRSIRARLAGRTIDFTVAMSVESLLSLASILGDADFGLLRNSLLVTPSRRVIQTARDRNPSIQCVLASDPRAQGMVSAMQGYLTATNDSSEVKQ